MQSQSYPVMMKNTVRNANGIQMFHKTLTSNRNNSNWVNIWSTKDVPEIPKKKIVFAASPDHLANLLQTHLEPKTGDDKKKSMKEFPEITPKYSNDTEGINSSPLLWSAMNFPATEVFILNAHLSR
jgi:hypothetical protein